MRLRTTFRRRRQVVITAAMNLRSLTTCPRNLSKCKANPLRTAFDQRRCNVVVQSRRTGRTESPQDARYRRRRSDVASTLQSPASASRCARQAQKQNDPPALLQAGRPVLGLWVGQLTVAARLAANDRIIGDIDAHAPSLTLLGRTGSLLTCAGLATCTGVGAAACRSAGGLVA